MCLFHALEPSPAPKSGRCWFLGFLFYEALLSPAFHVGSCDLALLISHLSVVILLLSSSLKLRTLESIFWECSHYLWLTGVRTPPLVWPFEGWIQCEWSNAMMYTIRFCRTWGELSWIHYGKDTRGNNATKLCDKATATGELVLLSCCKQKPQCFVKDYQIQGYTTPRYQSTVYHMQYRSQDEASRSHYCRIGFL